MENKKNLNNIPDVADEDLDAVSGGGGAPPGWTFESRHCKKCGTSLPYNYEGDLCPTCKGSSTYTKRY